MVIIELFNCILQSSFPAQFFILVACRLKSQAKDTFYILCHAVLLPHGCSDLHGYDILDTKLDTGNVMAPQVLDSN